MTPQYDVYQTPALATLKQARETGQKQALIVMAGGLGKTIIAARDLKDYFTNHLGRVLVLCHDNNILEQNLEKFHSVLGPEYSLGLFHGKHKTFRPVDVLFASFQTMEGKRKWKQEFRPEEFDYIIVDEAHHSRAKTYENVINYFKPQFLLGLTATPFREDGQPLDEIFGPAIYTLDYTEALVNGYLTPVNYNLMAYEIGKLGDAMASDQRFTLGTLDNNIVTRQTDEDLVADIMERLKDFDNPRTVIFCPTIEYAERIASLIPGAMSLHSNLSPAEQNDRLEKYRSGTVRTIVVVNKFNEGIDVPEIDIIIRLRQTDSRTVFQQQLFRGARVSDGKTQLVVFDYVSSAEQLRDLLLFEQRIIQAQSTSSNPSNTPRTPSEAPFVINLTGGEWKADKVDLLNYLNSIVTTYTDETLIQLFQDFAQEIGHTPTSVDVCNCPHMPTAVAYLKHFGSSWSNVLAAAGFEADRRMPRRYTKEELSRSLHEFAKELGHSPSMQEARDNKSLPSYATYCTCFNVRSWRSVLAAVGLNTDQCITYQTYTDEELIHLLRNFSKSIGHIPTSVEVDKAPDMPSATTYRSHFGSWKEVIHASNLEWVRPSSAAYTNKKLISALREFAHQIGHTPTVQEAKEAKNMPNYLTYVEHFGSWPKALEAASLAVVYPSHKRYTTPELISLLQDFAKQIGRPPSSHEVEKATHIPSATTFLYRFGGTWESVLASAGLSPNKN